MIMTPNIGKLLSIDEGLNHQIVDTFATVAESDLSWTEKIWLSIPKKDGSLQIDFGLGRYQNRNVMDAFGGISRGNEQWTVRASRELAGDPTATVVGPLTYEVVEPLHKVRVRLDENDVLPLTFDVTFEKKLPPYFEDRHAQRDERGFRVVSDVIRYHQAGTVSGWVRVEGKKEDVRPDEWFAFRDHSWGVRLDVGAPPTDLRPARDFGDRSLADSSFLLQWTPMLLERPDGTRYEFHYYLQMRDGRPFYFSGYLNHPDGAQERVGRVRPKLQYDDRTRRPKKGTISFDMVSGETRDVELEVVGDSGFYLGTALYLGFDGKKHGMWRGERHVDGERIPDTTEPQTLRRIHQLRDSIVRVREGGAEGFGIFESIATGAWPELGLSAAGSFL
jgi:hypothetical protein